ncbi:MAG: hypothetical protein CM15mP67_05010 [Alphaproteobacteria bacterium]|nr:MAG: hypothetical protein CM15mP67_05010 [Alphaproteobacteria bacterium]
MINIFEKSIKILILILLKAYKFLISPFLGTNCRFLPSCSDYACEAITSKGVIKGGALAIKRLTKCHPWGKSGYDPVNKQKKENIL